jgi:hypothetical protein
LYKSNAKHIEIMTNLEKEAKSYGTILDYSIESKVTLMYYNHKYWMFSEKTGTHVVNQENYNNHGFMDYDSIDSRAKLHWEGFISNQNK